MPMRATPLIFVGLLMSSCATLQTTPQTTGLLRLEVVPQDADVWVDGEYLGTVDGWRSGTIRVKHGHRRVELQAKGFMSQRFDIEVGADEEVTLRLTMQPQWDDWDQDVPEDS